MATVANASSPDSSPGERDRLPVALVFACYLVVGFAAYWSILRTYFVADDFAYLHDIAVAHSPSIIFSALAERYFRPAVVFFYYLNYQIAGLDPLTYHATVVLAHVVNATLLFALARSLRAPRLVAPLAGLLFLVFGGHSEAITWIGGMADPLVTMGVLVGMLVYLSALRSDQPLSRLLVLWLVYALTLLSKESGAVLTGMLVALTLLAAPEQPAARRVRILATALAGMAVVTLLYLGLRTSVLGFTFVRLEGLGTNRHLIATARSFLIRAFLPGGEPAITIFFSRLELIVGVPLAVMLLWRANAATLRALALIAICLGCAIAPVLPLSISLANTESERLVYMATAFAMLWLVWFVAVATARARVLVAVVAILSVWNGVALNRSNRNWAEASALIQTALPTFADVARAEVRPGRPIVFLNLPDSVRGAYVFRRGLFEALKLAAPEQASSLTNIGALSVYGINDTSRHTMVRSNGPRSVDVRVDGGWLIGEANPPDVWVALRDWKADSFHADFTPASDGSLLLYFTPQRIEVFRRTFQSSDAGGARTPD